MIVLSTRLKEWVSEMDEMDGMLDIGIDGHSLGSNFGDICINVFDYIGQIKMNEANNKLYKENRIPNIHHYFLRFL